MATLEEKFEIPEFQNACVFEEHGGPITYKQVPVPKPEPNEILVKILYTGVCHSDLHAWKGDWPNKSILPLIGGHEGSGIVVAKGSLVKNFKIGDFAGIKWLNRSCLDCEYCEKGFEISCSNGIEISGYTRNGTFQQYATADAMQAAHIPKGTDLAAIAPVLCAGVTVYRALKVANLQAGEWVAISGAGGGLGSYGIQYARALGLRVLAIDGGDEKGKLCKELGAEAYVDFTKSKDLIKEVQEITNGGPHGVINVSISELAVSQSCQYIRMLGKIVLVGIPSGAELKCPLIDVVFKCFEIKGTSVGNRLDTSETIDFFVRGLIKSPIKIVGLSELPQVFKLMLEGKIAGRYVLDTSK